MVTKNTFKKKFPDVKVQRLETKTVLSKREIEKIVINMCNLSGFGLLYFESSGKKITVYTSEKMKKELENMKKGAELKVHTEDGKPMIVISDEPFIIGGEYCIRIQLPNGTEDVFSCEFCID